MDERERQGREDEPGWVMVEYGGEVEAGREDEEKDSDWETFNAKAIWVKWNGNDKNDRNAGESDNIIIKVRTSDARYVRW